MSEQARTHEATTWRQQIVALLPPPTLEAVVLGALDRPDAEALLRRLTDGGEAELKGLERRAIVVEVVNAFFADAVATRALVAALDRATGAERSLLAS